MPHCNYSCTKQTPLTSHAPQTTRVRNKGLGLHICTTTQQDRHCRLQPAQRVRMAEIPAQSCRLEHKYYHVSPFICTQQLKKKKKSQVHQTYITVPHSVWQNFTRGFTLHCFLHPNEDGFKLVCYALIALYFEG